MPHDCSPDQYIPSGQVRTSFVGCYLVVLVQCWFNVVSMLFQCWFMFVRGCNWYHTISRFAGVAVEPSEPRTKSGLYWGFQTRHAPLAGVVTESCRPKIEQVSVFQHCGPATCWQREVSAVARNQSSCNFQNMAYICISIVFGLSRILCSLCIVWSHVTHHWTSL